MKICMACSAGGHLTEVMQLEGVYKKYDHFFVTFKKENSIDLADRERVYFITDPKRNPLKMIKNFFQNFVAMARERPDAVITTGAGVSVLTCYFAKLFGSKIIYIESYCRTDSPSLTGKMVYPIADMFFVQWRGLLGKFGEKAQYRGGVF